MSVVVNFFTYLVFPADISIKMVPDLEGWSYQKGGDSDLYKVYSQWEGSRIGPNGVKYFFKNSSRKAEIDMIQYKLTF